MGFTGLDFGIVIAYLVSITLFGVWIGKHQTNTKDYFLGNRNLPWLAISFSVIAAETSTLTFISIPGLAYISNLNFLQITFGYLIGRVIVSFVLLPAYYKGDIVTAYEFLGNRFGSKIRKFASVIFQLTRLLADGVRLFATAIPLSVITGWSYPVSIAIIGILTIIYTYIGGIRAVVWVDVIQMLIYLGGAIIAGVFILNHLPGGWHDVLTFAAPAEKFDIIRWGFSGGLKGFFSIDYTFLSGVLGGAFLSMASHGTDQLIVQRLLACKDLKQSQKALITSGVFVVFQFALFLMVGILLYVYYHGQLIGAEGFIQKSDQLFPKFIVEALPPGLSGIIIAGVFAAAMSTMSGSLNSLASSLMNDIYKPIFGKRNSEKKDLLLSRVFTAMWGLIFIGGAMIFKDRDNPVVELGLAIASFTYGGLLGAFLLGIIFKHVKENAAMYAMWGTIYFMTWIIGVQGTVQYVIIGLNILAFLWLFLMTDVRKEQIILVLILIVNTSMILHSPNSFIITWPWYVILGCVLSLGLGLIFQAFLDLGARSRRRLIRK
ncbi:sodium:solute symporter [candidate division KSB1 bacterium]|nr:sodium:solute symporter [candidate division KSB1 bacterium]